ncbi:MAG: DoxX family protein [Pseudomonadota bacterium]|nr:MAG: polyhydroxyalkanoate depolymerase [Pseudomonadota bacterium]
MKKTGWVMTILLLAFLLPASVAPKLVAAAVATDTMAGLGWSTAGVVELGVLELLLLLLFAWPRTAPLGAVLFTALLGGAVATHLRAGSPLATHTLFGVYVGIFMWVSLYLRDPRLRQFVQAYLLPGRSSGG